MVIPGWVTTYAEDTGVCTGEDPKRLVSMAFKAKAQQTGEHRGGL